jgi:hypothetical protein
MIYQISFSNTGQMKAICAQEYVEAESYEEAFAMGCGRAIGREVVVACEPAFRTPGSWRK